ncbi:MAG: fliA [Gammaproteobacteria bacterium]|jgi:RNA polymerase sigma factor for flagellar operon FliA|nr:fliA [Gammaproteobacteria bacterium]
MKKRPPDLHIIESYLPLVKWITHQVTKSLPTSGLNDDLIQVGIIGLIEAIHHFDKTKGASFKTYAAIRIRGAILDEIRKNDWLPRSIYRRLRDISSVTTKLSNQIGHAPKDRDIAKKLGMTITEYHHILCDATNNYMLDYDDIDHGLLIKEKDQKDSFLTNPLIEIESDDYRKILARSFQQLSDREQEVLSLYYYEELNLKDIAHLLKVSESRVCQIHSHAVDKLRQYLSQ